jgi:hypothetical protein
MSPFSHLSIVDRGDAWPHPLCNQASLLAVERGSIDVNFACWWAISPSPILSSFPRAYEFTFQIRLPRMTTLHAEPFDQRNPPRVSPFLQA